MRESNARLKELYLRMESLGPEAREAIIASELASEPELARSLRALLVAGDEADDGQFEPLVQGARGNDSRDLPKRIGIYTLEGLLGRGGMGRVFQARQDPPLSRAVALKVVSAGVHSESVFSRFESERSALARLQHRNIAAAFDAGVESNGLSWFAMELVQGPPLFAYCEELELSLEARFRIFAQVCRGVQHAHMRGILHRDLKPSNILVAIEDGEPVPKIIDFGVAKALGSGEPLSEVRHTLDRQLVGTLEYMSPEQARFGNPDVDARSDIYALGVILYELLSGRVPIGGRQFESKPLDQIQALIQEFVPLPPSQVSSPPVPEELNCLVMKALEKDPSLRYETAKDFGDEIDRFLRGEPLLARPPSRWYLLRKFVGRNRALVGVSLLVMFLVLIGFLGTSIGLYQAQEKEKELAQALLQARQLSERTRNIFLGVRPENRGRDVTLREVIAEAADDLLSDESAPDRVAVELAASLMDPLFTLGEYERSQQLAELILRADDEGLPKLSGVEVGLAKYRRAHTAFKLGDRESARTGFEDIVLASDANPLEFGELRYRVRLSLAELDDAEGKFEAGLRRKEEALELLEELDPSNQADRAVILGQLGRSYSQLGDPVKGLEYADEGYRLRRETAPEGDVNILLLQRAVAIIAMDAQDFPRALELLTENAPAMEKAHGQESTGALYSRSLLLMVQAREESRPSLEILRDFKATIELAERVSGPQLHLFLKGYQITAMLALEEREMALEEAKRLRKRGEEAFGQSGPQIQLRMMLATGLADFGEWDLARPWLEELLDDLTTQGGEDQALIKRIQKALADDPDR